MNTVQGLQDHALDQEEEHARAEMYGLLARLFCAPPDQSLLDRIAAAPAASENMLGEAWQVLAQRAACSRAEQVRSEYERLFIGIGKPDVLLYGSYHLSGFMMEKPLAALRTDLAALGLQRPESVAESEDHIAILCEVMRHLIQTGDGSSAAIDVQKNFFQTHMQTWLHDMCTAIEQHASADFYRPVARLADCFFEIESQAFDMG